MMKMMLKVKEKKKMVIIGSLHQGEIKFQSITAEAQLLNFHASKWLGIATSTKGSGSFRYTLEN